MPGCWDALSIASDPGHLKTRPALHVHVAELATACAWRIANFLNILGFAMHTLYGPIDQQLVFAA